MIIQRLRLLNFRQHEDTELILGAGLTGIIGPNGAGKTTLLEAIAWSIYGTPAARGTRESIRRRRAPPRSPVRVELEFALGPHQYRVVRTLHGAELYQDGDPSPIVTSLGAVSDRLERILGMTREEFFNTYFTSQKELAVMAAMTAPERAQFLSRVLGYEKIRRAQDRLKDRRTALRSRLQTLEGALPNAESLASDFDKARSRLAEAEEKERISREALEAAGRRLEEVQPKWEEVQRLKEQVASLEGDLRLAEHKVGAARERHQQLDRQLAEALTARGRLTAIETDLAPLTGLREERGQLDERQQAVAARRGFQSQLDDLRHRRKEVAAELAQIPAPEVLAAAGERRDTLAARRTELSAAIEQRQNEWVRDLQEAKTRRQTLLDQYKDIQEQQDRIREAGSDGACPTCARPLGDEFDQVLGLLDRQLEEVKFNGNYFRQRIEQLTDTPADLAALTTEHATVEEDLSSARDELTRFGAAAGKQEALTAEAARLDERITALEQELAASEAPYDAERHAEVRALIVKLEPLALEAVRLQVLADRAEELVQEAESAERDMSEVEGQVTALREQMKSLGFSEDAWAWARREAEEAERSRRLVEVDTVRCGAERSAAAEAVQGLERRQAQREVQAREIDQAAGDLALHNALDRAFTDLRTDLNATLRPDLSELASGFLRDLTNGRYSDLELDESYMAVVLEDGDAKPVISGGEEDVVNLALRLAISQMIAERAGQPLSLLVLDEIFGSLDEERRAGVLELLRGLADRFPQVILITHIESVREGFDRVIRVEVDVGRGAATAREDTEAPDGLAA